MLASQFHQWLQIKSDNNALKFLQENCYDLILIRILRSLANARLVSSKKGILSMPPKIEQYKCNIKQASGENKEIYQFGDN